MFVWLQTKYKGESPLIGVYQLPISDSLRHPSLWEIHPRMHTGNLSHGILKPYCVGFRNILGKFILGL